MGVGGEGTGFKLRVLSSPSPLPLPASQQLSGQKEAALRTGATSTLRKAGSPSQGTPTSGHLSPWTQRNIWNVSHQTGLPWASPGSPHSERPGDPGTGTRLLGVPRPWVTQSSASTCQAQDREPVTMPVAEMQGPCAGGWRMARLRV